MAVLVLPGAYFTSRAYGPMMVLRHWATECQATLCLVTNPASPEKAAAAHASQALIEILFSDQKEQGFHVHLSHLSLTEQLEWLPIAAALAYLWLARSLEQLSFLQPLPALLRRCQIRVPSTFPLPLYVHYISFDAQLIDKSQHRIRTTR